MVKKALQKPRVVFVFSRNRGDASTRFAGFARRLQKHGVLEGLEHATVALEDLIFIVDNNQQAHVVLADGTSPFAGASLVYFKSWESLPEEAGATATYLDSQGIPYVDHIVGGMGVGKLPQLLRIWAADLPVTPFAYGSITKKLLTEFLPASHYVIKSTMGEKGKDNSLVAADDIADLYVPGMLTQPFIANSGDYRVLTYGFKVRGALLRVAQNGSHLNNTSAGATSKFIELGELTGDVIKMAESAARATGHEVAGVDILPATNGELYVLEVNQGSQIATGHFTEQKMAAFGAYLHERMQNRYENKQPKKKLIGRHIRVDFPGLNIENVQGKVDTGAYQSALSSTNVYVKNDTLYFTPVINGVEATECSTNEFDEVEVVNTSGVPQKRYRIKPELVILGETIKTPVTLADRSGMKSPLLIGRRALRGRFLVNVELSRKAFEDSL